MRGIVFCGSPFGRPSDIYLSVRCALAPTVLHVTGISRNLVQIFIMWVGTTVKVIKVRGQRSRLQWEQMHLCSRDTHFNGVVSTLWSWFWYHATD